MAPPSRAAPKTKPSPAPRTSFRPRLHHELQTFPGAMQEGKGKGEGGEGVKATSRAARAPLQSQAAPACICSPTLRQALGLSAFYPGKEEERSRVFSSTPTASALRGEKGGAVRRGKPRPPRDPLPQRESSAYREQDDGRHPRDGGADKSEQERGLREAPFFPASARELI